MNSSITEESDSAGPSDRRSVQPIGEILVDANRLNSDDIEKVQSFAVRSGVRFGAAAIRLRLVSQDDVEFALARQFNFPLLTHGPGGEISDEVVAAYRPSSSAVEDLRTLRTRLLLTWLKHADRNVLAIVSPGRAEGRSWLAANLATVFAQAGQRTLLIDADLRRPRQNKLFHMRNGPGLSDALASRAGREIARRVHPRLRLFVSSSGRIPPNPQELLSGPMFNVVLESLSKQFDLILLDTPAASETADAEILASRAGSAILLARQNHTRHGTLPTTVNALLNSGTRILGTILNKHR